MQITLLATSAEHNIFVTRTRVRGIPRAVAYSIDGSFITVRRLHSCSMYTRLYTKFLTWNVNVINNHNHNPYLNR